MFCLIVHFYSIVFIDLQSSTIMKTNALGFSTAQPVIFFLTREVTLFFNYKSIPERLLHCGCPLRASGHQWAAVFVGLWIKGGVRWQIQNQRLGTGRLPEHRLMWTPFWRRTCAFVMLLALGKRACEMNKCKCKRESVQNLMPEY